MCWGDKRPKYSSVQAFTIDKFFCLWHAVCLNSNYIRMTKSSDNIPSHPFSRNCWFCLPRVLTILKYQVLMGFYCKWSRHHLNGKLNRQSFSFQINCQVENKWCYFFTHQPLNSKHPKVNIHTWRCEWYKTLHCGTGLEHQMTLNQKGSIVANLHWGLKVEMLRGYNNVITVIQLAICQKRPQTPTGAEARNEVCRSDSFVSGLLMSWKPSLKHSFSITSGDFKCVVRAAGGH